MPDRNPTLVTCHNMSFLIMTRQIVTEAQLWFSGGHTFVIWGLKTSGYNRI
jgi:hypothetical protein